MLPALALYYPRIYKGKIRCLHGATKSRISTVARRWFSVYIWRSTLIRFSSQTFSMTKKSFNDSFKEGMGGEIGKRTGMLVFGIIIAVIAGVLGLKSCEGPADIMEFNTTNSEPSNTQ